MKPDKKRAWKALIAEWSRATPACQVFLAERYTHDFPNDFFGWIVLADGLTQISSFENAAKALKTARRLSLPKHLELVFVRTGHYYREKGDLARAERWYRKAVGRSEAQEYLVFLGSCLAKQGRYAEARHYHERAVKIDPEKADEALFNLGLVFRAEKRFVEALRYFEMAIQIDADYEEAKIARDDIRRLLEIRASTNEMIRRKRVLDG